MDGDKFKNEHQCVIPDVIYGRYIEKIEREKREKQVMLDLWYMAINGKRVVLCVGNDYI